MYGNILSWQTRWKILGAPIRLASAEDSVAENIPTKDGLSGREARNYSIHTSSNDGSYEADHLHDLEAV